MGCAYVLEVFLGADAFTVSYSKMQIPNKAQRAIDSGSYLVPLLDLCNDAYPIIAESRGAVIRYYSVSID